MSNKLRVIVRCPKCSWRIFDKIPPTSGLIEIKCPRCHSVVQIDLEVNEEHQDRRTRIN